METVASRPTGALLDDLVLEGLRVPDPVQNAVAAELMARSGPGPVRRLIRVAADTTNRIDHRLRAMAVVGRIGRVAGEADLWDLAMLLTDDDAAVREAGRQLFWEVRLPGRPDDHRAAG